MSVARSRPHRSAREWMQHTWSLLWRKRLRHLTQARCLSDAYSFTLLPASSAAATTTLWQHAMAPGMRSSRPLTGCFCACLIRTILSRSPLYRGRRVAVLGVSATVTPAAPGRTCTCAPGRGCAPPQRTIPVHQVGRLLCRADLREHAVCDGRAVHHVRLRAAPDARPARGLRLPKRQVRRVR